MSFIVFIIITNYVQIFVTVYYVLSVKLFNVKDGEPFILRSTLLALVKLLLLLDLLQPLDL